MARATSGQSVGGDGGLGRGGTGESEDNQDEDAAHGSSSEVRLSEPAVLRRHGGDAGGRAVTCATGLSCAAAAAAITGR